MSCTIPVRLLDGRGTYAKAKPRVVPVMELLVAPSVRPVSLSPLDKSQGLLLRSSASSGARSGPQTVAVRGAHSTVLIIAPAQRRDELHTVTPCTDNRKPPLVGGQTNTHIPYCLRPCVPKHNEMQRSV